ncbi:MAG: hypothetical protein JSR77_16175 [Planctomycetes bacterium]|nr:hypothetical protein [Planctomycetota bacterium]
MSSVCVLTPMVVGSWPLIANAIAGTAASLGFTIAQHEREFEIGGANETERVEAEVANSEVVAETMGRAEKMTIERGGVRIEFGVDDRGRCTVCASGKGMAKRQLKAIADEVAGKVVQQFAYHKLMTELKQRKFRVLNESVGTDQAIQIQVQLDR